MSDETGDAARPAPDAPREDAPDGAEATLVRGVVVGHGAMAAGLVDAVRRISGAPEDALVPLSNEGLGPDALREELDRLVGAGPTVVFTDMHSGSCALAARLACRVGGERAVVCGVNLPMLLDFVFHRDVAVPTLVERLVERGRSAVTAHTTR